MARDICRRDFVGRKKQTFVGKHLASIIVSAILLSNIAAIAQQDTKDDQQASSSDPDFDKAARFGKREDILDVALSPDGNKIMVLSAGPGAITVVQWADLNGGAGLQRVMSSDGHPNQLRWCEFVANDRVLCSVDVIKTDGVDDIGFNRKIAFDLDGDNMLILGQSASDYDVRLRQYTGSIIDWMDGSGKVLMSQDYIPEGRSDRIARRNDEGLGVVELDTRSNKTRKVENPNPMAIGYWGDGADGVRMVAFRANSGTNRNAGSSYRFDYRLKGDREWRRFGTFEINAEGKTRDFWPLAIDDAANKVYGLMPKDGRDALYSVSLDGQFSFELVFAHPRVDVGGIVRFGQDGRVVGVSYADEHPQVVYFDKYLNGLAKSLSKALPGLPLISFVDASVDEKKLLIRAGSDDDPGRLYIFNKDGRQLAEIMHVRPMLNDFKLSNVEAITYQASDGTSIPGYLTLPPGMERSTARNLPTIVMPHGGPASRDIWDFDWLAQYFANLGYAVLQPNFRGSSGYGDEWFVENGFKSWRVAIGDINDGARWAIGEGVANPEKMAIIGWSYGGYAALQSGVVEPGLFKAIGAIAPLTDMKDWTDEFRNFTNFRTMQRYVGSGPHIVEGSPLQNVGSISVPVILFHGDRDMNVGVRQSRRMEQALKSAGKSVEYHEFKDLDHQLPDSNVRAFMLLRLKKFLDRTL
ncbi:MAG: alpha/beta fold hydrolase [Blastomonas sp.]